MKRWVRRIGVMLVLLSALGAAGFAAWRMRRAQAAESLPTAPARKGDFLVIVRCRGELKARRSVQVNAPVNVPELRIVWLAASGTMVKENEPIIKFDPSSAKQQSKEKEAALKQAQAALDQAIAQGRLAGEQDKLELADARYKTERAKLEVSKAEIVSALQAEESKIELGLAEQKMGLEQAKGKLNDTSNEAKVASLRRARDKAKDELELTEYRLSQMEQEAPITGLINYLPNNSQGWMNAKPFKVGDQVWPGAAVAEIPDLETLEMEGKVEEIDRGKIAVDQQVRIRIDALPETTFPGKLEQLSPMTVMGWDWPPTRTFRGFAKLEKIDPRLRPGMNGAMDVVVNKIPNAISVPVKALFTLGGRPVVYVAEKDGYRSVQVDVLARNPDEAAVQGIPGGVNLALVEPDKKDLKR